MGEILATSARGRLQSCVRSPAREARLQLEQQILVDLARNLRRIVVEGAGVDVRELLAKLVGERRVTKAIGSRRCSPRARAVHGHGLHDLALALVRQVGVEGVRVGRRSPAEDEGAPDEQRRVLVGPKQPHLLVPPTDRVEDRVPCLGLVEHEFPQVLGQVPVPEHVLLTANNLMPAAINTLCLRNPTDCTSRTAQAVG